MFRHSFVGFYSPHSGEFLHLSLLPGHHLNTNKCCLFPLVCVFFSVLLGHKVSCSVIFEIRLSDFTFAVEPFSLNRIFQTYAAIVLHIVHSKTLIFYKFEALLETIINHEII